MKLISKRKEFLSFILTTVFLLSFTCSPVFANDIDIKNQEIMQDVIVDRLDTLGYVSDCPAAQIKMECVQPSGETFTVIQHGSASFFYAVTDDGYMVRRANDGYWYYMEEQANTETGKQEIALSDNRCLVDQVPNKVVTEEKYRTTSKSNISAELISTPEEVMGELIEEDMKEEEKIDQNAKKTPAAEISAATSGDIPLLVVLVGFSDISLTYSDYLWSQRFFGTTNKSIKNYYLSTSNSKINFVPIRETKSTANDGIVRVNLNMKHPFPNNGNTFYGTETVNRAAIEEAVKSISLTAYSNPSKVMSDLRVVLIYAGYEQSFNASIQEHCVWANHSKAYTYSVKISGTTYSVNGRIVIGERHKFIKEEEDEGEDEGEETQPDSTVHQATIGIIAHELGHALGLRDLYVDNNNDTDTHSNIGIFSVMSYSWACMPNEKSGTTPPQLDAYSKIKLGIYSVTTKSSVGSATVSAYTATTQNRVYKIPTNISSVYYLVENRTYDSGVTPGTNLINYDMVIKDSVFPQNPNYQNVYDDCGYRNDKGGLIIYYVDERSNKTRLNLLRANRWEDESDGMKYVDEAYYRGNNKSGSPQPAIMNNADITLGTDTNTKIYPWFMLECLSSPSTSMTFTITTNNISLGDVDGDGEITSTDARIALSIYSGTATVDTRHLDAADVDGKEGVTSTDARLILQYYSGKITTFPRLCG